MGYKQTLETYAAENGLVLTHKKITVDNVVVHHAMHPKQLSFFPVSCGPTDPTPSYYVGNDVHHLWAKGIELSNPYGGDLLDRLSETWRFVTIAVEEHFAKTVCVSKEKPSEHQFMEDLGNGFYAMTFFTPEIEKKLTQLTRVMSGAYQDCARLMDGLLNEPDLLFRWGPSNASFEKEIKSRLGLGIRHCRHDKISLLNSEAEMLKWRKAFHSVTPGGSEFMDPEYCVQYVRDRQQSQHEKIVALIRQLKEATK